MGIAHNQLQLGKLLWTHLGIDLMDFFAMKWRILSNFSCFPMEGSQRLQRMLRNSGGLSVLRGRLGVQVVVDNHTIDDSLAAHGWDATRRAQHGQGPIRVQRYASRTRRQLLTDMLHLQTPERRFRWCKKRLREHDQGPLLPVVGVHAGAPGAHSPGVRAKVGVAKSEIQVTLYEIRANSHQFMCTARPRVSPLSVLGAVRTWWMPLGQDLRWMMRSEIGA